MTLGLSKFDSYFIHCFFLSQFDRTKKPSVRVLDESKPSQNGSVKDANQNGPFVPDRSVKPPLNASTPLSKEEQSQIHSEVLAMREKAKQEQEKRIQERRTEDERREKEQQEKELRERLEREESDKKKKKQDEDKKHQDKKKLERQEAEEEEDKENKSCDDRRGKDPNSDTPSKSMSLDSPAPNHIVSEIKVSPLCCPC